MKKLLLLLPILLLFSCSKIEKSKVTIERLNNNKLDTIIFIVSSKANRVKIVQINNIYSLEGSNTHQGLVEIAQFREPIRLISVKELK